MKLKSEVNSGSGHSSSNVFDFFLSLRYLIYDVACSQMIPLKNFRVSFNPFVTTMSYSLVLKWKTWQVLKPINDHHLNTKLLH